MAVTIHTSQKYKTRYYLVGKHKVIECEVIDHWIRMCGEDAVKKYLSQCGNDGMFTTAGPKE